MSSKPDQICILKITLVDSSPKIWRQVIFPLEGSLDLLHAVIQISVGWQFAHLYEFMLNGERYVDHEMIEEADGYKDVSSATIKSLNLKKGDSLEYSYDFGDGWEHLIELVEIREAKNFEPVFGCRDGAGQCPPEDCGGMDGYEELIEVKNNPAHPRYKELSEWIDLDSLNPEKFELNEINNELQYNLMLDDEEAEMLAENLDREDFNQKDELELLKRQALAFSVAATSQIMADEPSETRETIERLVSEGIEEEDALAMVISTVGEEVATNSPYNKKRLLKNFAKLPGSLIENLN